MNEQQYRLLCEACDRLLLAPDSTIERIAISWLHIVREHPVFLANYTDLFAKDGYRVRTRRIFRRLIRKIFTVAKLLFHALKGRGRSWIGSAAPPERVDVLFISHLLNRSHAGLEDDFYYGDLPRRLASRGYSVAIALINQLGKHAESLAHEWSSYSVPRFVLSVSLGLREEMALRQRLKVESAKLSRAARREEDKFERKVLLRASRESRSAGSASTLRLCSQISALVKVLQPGSVVVTYEGHAWERVAMAGARRACPHVQCIGYQHAALFRLQHAIRRRLAPVYNPDYIFTAGKVGATQLRGALDLHGIPITVLGSNRRIDVDPIHAGSYSSRVRCLVLPEGIESECHLLFDYSIACAKAFPEAAFIWRLHPIVSFESLAARNPKLRRLPSNIDLSHATLKEDIAKCNIALYRGTTAIISAVMAGLRPVYLRTEEELTIDPIYDIESYRVTVQTVNDFRLLPEMCYFPSSASEQNDRDSAIKYCEGFFTPLEYGRFETVIRQV